MNAQDFVKIYLDRGYRIVVWPTIGDAKGPQGVLATGWTEKVYSMEDYRDGCRVGIVTGTEVSPGRYLHDVDVDWAPGALIAKNLLPSTGFVFGRTSKRLSHFFYTLPEGLPSFAYRDVDKSTLIELRGTKLDGSIGCQTMCPPSIWSKEGQREPLAFIHSDLPAHLENLNAFRQRICLAAIGMILAKHLGTNGFGHDNRLAWAGYLLRAGIAVEDLITMGEAMSIHCNNKEIGDVRRTVESTAARLTADSKAKTKGGPSLAKAIGEKGKAVIARINEWLGKDSDFIRNTEGLIIKDSQENIRRAVILLNHELSYDEFSDKMLLDKVIPLEDRQVTDLWLRMDEDFRLRPTFTFFERVLKKMAWDNSFHPVKDYLSTLTWDGHPRIDMWLVDSAGAEDSLFLRAVSSIVLIAAVRRIRSPGAKYDELLVLEGAQGLNKSSALRALCPKSDWFSDDLPLNINSQKMIEATLGKWVIEAADLAGKRKAEVEQLKATLSRQVDGPARLAYAHLPVERARQFVIIGTTNSSAYLTDPTGARRFWPVRISQFDVEWIKLHRDQMWAEAAHREAQGESIRLAEELWPEATKEQDKRREIDTWEAPIRKLLFETAPGSGGKRRVVSCDIWTALGIEIKNRDRYGAMRITEIMQKLGFKRTRVRPVGQEVQMGFVTEFADKLELLQDSSEVEEDILREPGSDDIPF